MCEILLMILLLIMCNQWYNNINNVILMWK